MNVGICPLYAHQIDPAFVARKAEDLGFESIWYAEHPIMPVRTSTPFPGAPDGIIPDHYARFNDPYVILARASAVTSRIKLATGITLVPERNPLILAKEVATLDYFSGGRVLLGIGVGWLREETEIMGGDFAHRWSQTKEAVQVMKVLWANEQAEFHGKYFDFPLVRSFPKPAQVPHPPILYGGSVRDTLQRVVAVADGWMPNHVSPAEMAKSRPVLDRLATEAGRDPASITMTAFGHSPEAATVNSFFDAGVDRVVVWAPNANNEQEMAQGLERIASDLSL